MKEVSFKIKFMMECISTLPKKIFKEVDYIRKFTQRFRDKKCLARLFIVQLYEVFKPG